MNFEIDYVFPMVNPFDPVWQKEYAKYFDDNPIYNPRHRKSPKLLRYMLRSLAKNMPWIDRLFMVVALPSQVPSWINRNTVNVILHKDIIPEGELPTFNTCTVDKYVNLIPGLSEHYIYGYDDFYAMRPIEAGQFFAEDGTPVQNPYSFKVRKFATDLALQETCRKEKWYSICNKSYEVMKAAYGKEFFEKYPQKLQEPFMLIHMHMFMPQTKSIVADVMRKCGVDGMLFSKGRDFNQVLPSALTVMYVSCMGAAGEAPTNAMFKTYNEKMYKDVSSMTQDQFCHDADQFVKDAQCVCINYNNDMTRPMYASWLESKFPDKCKYEA